MTAGCCVCCDGNGRDVSATNPYGESEAIVLSFTDVMVQQQRFRAGAHIHSPLTRH